MTEMELLTDLLRDLSAYVRERYADRASVEVGSKSEPNDLLTEVDVAVQRRAMERIAREFPSDHFVGEEEGMHGTPEDRSSRMWVMDPIDGTQNFVLGLFPAFGISLAFVAGGALKAGGVSMPMTNDLFLAEHGGGAFRNGQRLRVSDVGSLGIARVEVDFGSPSIREANLKAAGNIILKGGQIRCHCAAVGGICSGATGDMDGYVHVKLSPWDYAASVLIAQEAGGKATRFDGAPLDLFGGSTSVLVTNGVIHREMVAGIGARK